MQKTIVLSLGGSLIIPDGYDANFLGSFKKNIEKFLKLGYKFVIVCGGGKLARNVQEAASKISKVGNDDLDWLGIHATRLNALVVRYIFGNDAQDPILFDPTEDVSFKKNIIIAAGWKPGWSTDYDAVLIAKNLGVKEVINMSNVEYIYDKDPKKFNGAKKIENIEWGEFRKLIDGKWKAGMNAPFDPVAAKEAQNSKITAYVIGKDLKNLENLLHGKEFKGTVIG